MSLWRRIRKLSIDKLSRLGFLLLKNPFQILPTWNATQQTLKICDKYFGKRHHKRGKANAFRHALWNVKICQKSLKWTKNEQKSVNWAKKVTDLFEKVAKNDPLDTAMDLHNNAIGRKLFFEQKEADFVQILLKMIENGQKVTKIEQIGHFENQLIYISE